MAQISRIESAGPERKARRLHLDDGDEPLLTSAAVVRVLGLEVGNEVIRTELTVKLETVARECAHERVLRVLGYRDRSVEELRRKLLDDGYAPPLVEGLVDRFTELDLLNDERFARQWVVSRRAAGYGAMRIERELRSKGVDVEIAATAAFSEDDEEALRRARALVLRVDVDDRKARDRAFARLIRKGFSSSIAARALRRDELDS